MQRTCARIVASAWFDFLIFGVIIANAVVLGLDTYDSIRRDAGGLLHTLNDVFLGVFVVELAIRIGAYGRRPQDFFKSGWNVFDFVVIGAAFLPGLRENSTLLRLVRLARVLRVIRLLPELRLLITAVMRRRSSGSRRITLSTRARRTRRSSVEFSRSPGKNAAPMTTKSNTFQPLLKKSCGRRP